MPIFALYNFNDAGTDAIDVAVGNGEQNGIYLDGASSVGGRAVLDGIDDKVKIYPSETFQLDRGTLEIQFSQGAHQGDGANTVLSRDTQTETPGGYRIEVLADGAIVITHEVAGSATTYQTEPGFLNSGDEINIVYSWDQATGGTVQISNLTTDTLFEAATPPGLSMDQGPISQPWIIGAGQSNSDAGVLNNIDQYFQGSVEMFSLSDSVDNGPVTPVANPDVAETDEDTPVVIPVLANDTDPNLDPLSIVGVPVSANGTVEVNPDGTLTYTPAPDFNGEDTITYTITDPDGNQSTSTVTVTVNPVNDAPVATDDSGSTPFNTPVTVPVLGNDTDVDGDTLSLVGVPVVRGGDEVGTVAVNGDGSVTFTPATGFTGEALIDYTVTDTDGLTDDAVVTIAVGEPDRDGIVRGTDDGNLIDLDYIDPFDADRVDAGDAILTPDAPNDDRIRAEAGNDTVYAGLGDDTVFSGLGDDEVYGGVGDDDLRGNEGRDTLIGGEGRDTVYGQQDDDLIDTGSALQRPDIDYPGLYPADTDPNDDRDLVYGGLGNDTIRTGDDADTIYGDGGNDNINAGVDADLVYGGNGNDTIVGSEGADTIYADGGNDLVYGGLDEVIGDALDLPDAVDLRPLNNADLLFGGAGNDTIYGRDDNDTLNGDAGNDVLFGGIDNDSMTGGAGNDTLFGGAGLDTMAGGDDRDVFIIDAPTDGISDVIDGNEGGDDFDTLDLRGSGPLRIDYADDNPENGVVNFLDADGNPTGTLNFVNIENVIPCFTPGTMIATPKGEVPVESLKAGDRVITRDNGIQEIRWTGKKAMDWAALTANPHLRPVMIRQGSLGNGLPERDMMVSPNHRVLVANDRTALYFDEHEVLVAAKHLVGGKGIFEIESIGTSYLHFMFDQHEVVLSNGAWTESFQPGDYTLKGMGNAQRSEIFDLFPELKTQTGLESYMAARRTLKRHEASLLVR